MKTSSEHHVTNEELVFKIVETNSAQSFVIFYDRFSEVVYNKCDGLSKNKREAEDLIDDVFIRLFVKLKTIIGNSKFSKWLCSFTYNFSVNYVQINVQIKEDTFDEIEDVQIVERKSESLASGGFLKWFLIFHSSI